MKAYLKRLTGLIIILTMLLSVNVFAIEAVTNDSCSQFNITVFWEGFTLIIYCIAIVATVSSLVMYVKCLYQNGFIDKNDLNAENKNVAIKSEKDCQ